MLIFTIMTLLAHSALSLYVIIAVRDEDEDDGLLINCKALFYLNAISLALDVLFEALLIYLTCYHEFLMQRNISTFQHI